MRVNGPARLVTGIGEVYDGAHASNQSLTAPHFTSAFRGRLRLQATRRRAGPDGRCVRLRVGSRAVGVDRRRARAERWNRRAGRSRRSVRHGAWPRSERRQAARDGSRQVGGGAQGRTDAPHAGDSRRGEVARRQIVSERQGRAHRHDQGEVPRARERRPRQVPAPGRDPRVLRLQADDDRARHRSRRGLVYRAPRARTREVRQVRRDDHGSERVAQRARLVQRAEVQGLPRRACPRPTARRRPRSSTRRRRSSPRTAPSISSSSCAASTA